MSLSPHLKSALTTAALELGLLAVAWYFMGLDEVLVGAIALVIVVGAFSPPRIGRWVGGTLTEKGTGAAGREIVRKAITTAHTVAVTTSTFL